ncbi:MAG: ComEA family DNA-binding protein [Lachnospiraceae bacterium]|nr:ComEA family DNA-binding protein [Lachnospiraceae bacterium]
MPKQHKKRRFISGVFWLSLLFLPGCDLPDLFSDSVTSSAEDFVLEALTESGSLVDMPSETEGTIFVYVVGEVLHPGVYELKSGERLDAAIRAAGGFTEAAEPASVNLARPVTDGEQVEVLSREAYVARGVIYSQTGSGLVNINTADVRELMTLPGIGETRAQAIIDHRNKHGPFETIEAIMQVSGIKQAAFEQIRDKITTGR